MTMRRTFIWFSILLSGLLFDCESADRLSMGGPRGLRAADHVEVASVHQRLATEQQSGASSSSRAHHRELAANHLRMSEELQKNYSRQCANLSLPQAMLSPLYRYGIGGTRTDNGMVIHLRQTTLSSTALAEQLSCHRAWMMLAPADMEECPLDLPNVDVKIESGQDGLQVELTTDPWMVPELQRRVEASGVGVPLPLPPYIAKRER